MPTKFEEYTPGTAPTFLQGQRGKEFLTMLGKAYDKLVSQGKDAVKCRFIENSPTDALPYNGSAMSIERYPTDTDDTYRERIKDAFNTWQFAGTFDTVLDQVHKLLPDVPVGIIVNRDWIPPDGDTAWWSRFWVTVENSAWDDDDEWGDPGDWGDGGLWGTSATAEELTTLKKVIKKWKPSETIGYALLAFGEGDFWGPGVPWESGLWGDTSIVIIAVQ